MSEGIPLSAEIIQKDSPAEGKHKIEYSQATNSANLNNRSNFSKKKIHCLTHNANQSKFLFNEDHLNKYNNPSTGKQELKNTLNPQTPPTCCKQGDVNSPTEHLESKVAGKIGINRQKRPLRAALNTMKEKECLKHKKSITDEISHILKFLVDQKRSRKTSLHEFSDGEQVELKLNAPRRSISDKQEVVSDDIVTMRQIQSGQL